MENLGNNREPINREILIDRVFPRVSFFFFLCWKRNPRLYRIFEKKNPCFALVETRIIKKKKNQDPYSYNITNNF